MNIDQNDLFQVLLGELRYYADVRPRWRSALPDHGTVKVVSEADARDLAARHGGAAEHSEVWVLPGGWQLLAPWEPAPTEPASVLERRADAPTEVGAGKPADQPDPTPRFNGGCDFDAWGADTGEASGARCINDDPEHRNAHHPDPAAERPEGSDRGPA